MSSPKRRSDAEKLVGFRVGDVAYAVRIDIVREIINPIAVTELPHAPRAVAGVADHRGEVVPVIDLRVRFGLPPLVVRERSKWILVSADGRTVGLMVDKVTEVFPQLDSDLRPPPELGGGEDERGIEGVTTHQGEMVFVLDVARLGELARAVESASDQGRKRA